MSAEHKLVAVLTVWVVALCLLGFANILPSTAMNQHLGKTLNYAFVVMAAVASAALSFHAVLTKNSRS